MVLNLENEIMERFLNSIYKEWSKYKLYYFYNISNIDFEIFDKV